MVAGYYATIQMSALLPLIYINPYLAICNKYLPFATIIMIHLATLNTLEGRLIPLSVQMSAL